MHYACGSELNFSEIKRVLASIFSNVKNNNKIICAPNKCKYKYLDAHLFGAGVFICIILVRKGGLAMDYSVFVVLASGPGKNKDLTFSIKATF